MHLFHDYITGQLEEKLKKRGVVVFYDPRREFEPYFEREFEKPVSGFDSLSMVVVQGRDVHLAQYHGSFFELRNAVEPIAGLERPDRLIVYLPGVERDRKSSVLMELEKSGMPYEPQLRRLARRVLQRRFNDGQIDEMLRPDNVGYDDIVSFLHQSEQGISASVLRTIFDRAQGESLITRWLADEGNDETIVDKDAARELFDLIQSRLGLSIPKNTVLAEAREKLLRYALVGEFRLDLECDPPPSVAMVPEPQSKERAERLRSVAATLRLNHASRYVNFANKIEMDLGLADAGVDPARLGKLDTFRFEERSLLAHAGEVICTRDYRKALGIVADRSRSFWVDRDVGRRAQWEACRLMAELGHEIEKVLPALGRTNGHPGHWVEAYASDGGWFHVDELHRRLETWVANMDEEPEAEKALAIVRRAHEELLKKMADGFAQALRDAEWAVSGTLHQTRVYPEVVRAMGGRVGYFFVDALRFEMGVELVRQLEGEQELTLRPAIAAIPTITPVGMAALLPGASASFSVGEHNSKLAALIEGTAMSGLAHRLKFLKAKIPDVAEMPLGTLLGSTRSKLSKAIGHASLVIVRSQEIDALGENIDELTARAAMGSVIGNVARAIRKLASAGIENFVVSADHGHQFSIRKDDDMKTDNPGGDTLDIHRRCWIGHGGTTPPGTVRVSGADLGYETELDFVFPTGLGVFKTGGGLTFHHGGVSLQEIVVPVVSLRIPTPDSQAPAEKTATLLEVPEQVTNRTFGIRVFVSGDLLSVQPVAVRVVLFSGNEQVGQAGMAIGGYLDPASGILEVNPNSEASVGMMLTRDDCDSVRVVILNPATDAVLDQSEDLPVKLGI